MKKGLVLLLCLGVCISVTACGKLTSVLKVTSPTTTTTAPTKPTVAAMAGVGKDSTAPDVVEAQTDPISDSSTKTQSAATGSGATGSTLTNDGRKSFINQTKAYMVAQIKECTGTAVSKWDETFVEHEDWDTLLTKYLAGGGKISNPVSFAEYVAKNAPVLEDWKKLFEASLKKTYPDHDVVRYEPISPNLYQAYVMDGGKEVPYVTVNARTGFFHG